MRVMSMVLAMVALGACQPDYNNVDHDAISSGKACGADELQHLLGKNIDTDLAEGVVGRPYRVLMANQQITQELSPSRLNVVHDEQGTVVRIYCG